jgi:hypothetical protein
VSGANGFVFLSHNSRDKPAVETLAHALLDAGVRPRLDKWDLVPGLPWQKRIADALRDAQAVVVCIGEHGIGHVQNPEVEAALDRAWPDSNRPVIPVLLPGAAAHPEMPDFLRLRTSIDFRQGVTDTAIRQLVAAAAGRAVGPLPASDAPAPYLYWSNDGREDPGSREERVVRSGAYNVDPRDLRVSARYSSPRGARAEVLGFRCARDVPS